MSSQENGHPALAADEPGKLSVISNRELTEWYNVRKVSMDSRILASGLSHCKLLASVFPASVDVKKIKIGYFTVVSSHNWKLFTAGMDRIGIKKIFNVAKLQLPNSVEIKQLNVWMKEFVEMNEKKFVGVPMEERPGADALKNGSQGTLIEKKMTKENGEIMEGVKKAPSEKKNTEIGKKVEDDLAKRGENGQNEDATKFKHFVRVSRGFYGSSVDEIEMDKGFESIEKTKSIPRDSSFSYASNDSSGCFHDDDVFNNTYVIFSPR